MKKWLKILFWLLMTGAGSAALVVWLAIQHYGQDLPTLNGLADYQPNLVTRVYARDYQLMGEFYVERRQFVPLAEMPKELVNALLATEDTDFYHHPGISIFGIMRAAVANVLAHRLAQGASTITQQVAKTFLLSSERTLSRKVKEIILSYRIEQRFSKDEILELYLNQIYLGAGAYGVGAAARIYFNRDVSELTLGQMALLAGLPKAPSRYDPWRSPEAARQRQSVVLHRMVEAKFLSDEQAKAAAAEPLGLARSQATLEEVAPHFLEHVRRTMMAEWGMQRLYRGGLDIYTTLDPRMQKAAQTAVQHGVLSYDRRNGYRGPLNHLEGPIAAVRSSWLEGFQGNKEESQESDSGYFKALVTEITHKQTAAVVLADGRKGELGLKQVEWARKQYPSGRLGPAVKKVAEVLQPGDVILLEATPDGKGFLLAQEPNVESALVSLDPHTGQILAMVGGYDYGRSEFNRATQGRRQPGSSFKPFIYAAALNSGLKPNSIIDDSPLQLPYYDYRTRSMKVWNPQNFEHRYYGPTTMRVGLEHSRNVVTIRLLQEVGVPNAVSYVSRFGLTVPPGRANLTLALGTVDFTPLQMTAAYGVFANGGKLVEPVYIARVQDRLGRTVFRHSGGDCQLCHGEHGVGAVTASVKGWGLNNDDEEGGAAVAGVVPQETETPSLYQAGKQVIDQETAYQVVSLLKGVVARGTAVEASKMGRYIAGKTGTTNSLRDAWFIGFSPALVAAVWVGKDDFTPLGMRETGAHAALPIWKEYMSEALKEQPNTDFPVPPGIYLEPVDLASGVPSGGGRGGTVMEAFRLSDRLMEQAIEEEIRERGEEDKGQEIEQGIY